jgi:hypothetical protein
MYVVPYLPEVQTVLSLSIVTKIHFKYKKIL